MSNAPKNRPEPIPFEPPGANEGPTEGANSNWVGWRIADARANALQAEKDRLYREWQSDKDQLHKQVRSISSERAGLVERISAMEGNRILTSALGALLFSVAGILAGFAVVAVSGEETNRPLLLVACIVGPVLLVAGFVVQVLPFRSHRNTSQRSD